MCIVIACLIHLLQSIVIFYIVYNIALKYIMKTDIINNRDPIKSQPIPGPGF